MTTSSISVIVCTAVIWDYLLPEVLSRVVEVAQFRPYDGTGFIFLLSFSSFKVPCYLHTYTHRESHTHTHCHPLT